MSCKDMVSIENPIKVPRWQPNPSPAGIKFHHKQIEVESESFISLPPPSPDAIFYPTEMMNKRSSPREMEVEVEVERLNNDHTTVMRIIDIDDGVYMAWKDLWVSVPEKKKKGGGGWRPILEGVTGYVEPGEVLAIMGPSGSGKSSLIDALAGRLGSNTRQTGDILINGRKQTLSFGTSAYVTQDDVLMTTLTVKEAVFYSAQLQLPDSMSRSEKKKRAETTIKEMGLQDAINTRIGGWTVKGLSGGQKRRVSICVEILTRPKLLFLDEPTSGLDSATSYHVMNHIIKLAQRDKKTVIASIHQPSSEVFELFHSVCLLSSGRTVYFGSTSAATEFFSANGFPCPSMRNPSDHFLKTINKDFDSDIEDDVVETSTVRVINFLVNSYKSSEVCQKVEQRVFDICSQKRAKLEGNGKKAGFITQCLVLTKRSFINMFRDPGYYWFSLVIYTALGLCMGTLYYDIGHSYGSIQARGSMLMFIAAFLTFMAIGGFPSYVEDMKIFTRERLNGHYGVEAFVIGNSLSSIPYLAMMSILPGVLAYYLVRLQNGFDHFFYFCFLLFTCLMLVESIMMVVASIVPDYLIGIIAGAGIQGLMILNAGFFRLPNDLPKPVWKYPIYYIAFHKYAFEGFFKNEYEGLSFPNENIHGPPIITGHDIVAKVWQMDTSYSKWVDVGILFGMIIIYRLIFFGIIKSIEKVKPMIQASSAKPSRNSIQDEINEKVLVVFNEKKVEMEAEIPASLYCQNEVEKEELEGEFLRSISAESEKIKAFQTKPLQQIQTSDFVLHIQ